MARERTGTIDPFKREDGSTYFRARVRLGDGSRVRVDLPEKVRGDEKRARWYAQALQEREDDKGELLAKKRAKAARKRARTMPTAEMAAWLETWIDDRDAKGQTSTRENRSHYENHIAPAIGPRHVRDWTIDDMRMLSRALDEKIEKGAIAWKTARNVWVTAGKMLDDAKRSKRDDLRCRESNPIRDVEGPNRGADRARAYLYPNEALRFFACKDVPLAWRCTVAIAIFTFARAAELHALRWEDVDLEHGTIHIHRARDRRTGADKPTKSKLARRFALEPTIVPLLTAMHLEAEARAVQAKADGEEHDDHVLALPSDRDLARGLRRWLAKAGVRRAELTRTDATRQQLRFHDLRATGITWMAVRGDAPQSIMHRAGHTDFATTQLYIREAEIMREGFGVVFPPLPIAELCAPAKRNPSAASPREIASRDDSLGQPLGQTAVSLDHVVASSRNDEAFWRGGRDSKPGSAYEPRDIAVESSARGVTLPYSTSLEGALIGPNGPTGSEGFDVFAAVRWCSARE